MNTTATIPNSARIYTSHSIETLPKTTDRSCIYWRAQARQILARHPLACVIIHDSRTDAINAGELRRGADRPLRPNAYLIIASTGGKFGRSRENLVGVAL